MYKSFSIFGMLIAAGAATADVKPHSLFTENAVLQRGMNVPVWGTANSGEQVTVEMQGQKAQTKADSAGQWKVELAPLEVGGPFTMTIKGSNTIQLKNVLVGEVWICSGQSNMQWSVRASADPDRTANESTNPMIRLFTVPMRPAMKPERDVAASWQSCNPGTVPNFSAVAYFFGKDLQKALNVPVGLIHTSWGGTPAEAWTSKPMLEATPSLRYYADNQLKVALDQFDRHLNDLKKYRDSLPELLAAGKQIPDPPRQPQHPAKNPWVPASLYNGMIAPLIPYASRGAIWYQGESNAGKAYEYRTLLATMVENWRKDWRTGDFTFLIVQLAPFMKIQSEPAESAWAELREAQLLVTKKLPKVGIAVITDVGEENDIHPKQKAPVGSRLALAARGIAYGENIVYSGPLYDSIQIEGDKAVLSFKHVGGGLVCKGEKLTGFTIAGENKAFHNAEAEIVGDKIVVRSPKVAKPIAVRFGWANYPVVNLFNKEGLPATPFRTDDFPLMTMPKSASAQQ